VRDAAGSAELYRAGARSSMRWLPLLTGLAVLNAAAGVANLSVGSWPGLVVGTWALCVAIGCAVCAVWEWVDPIKKI
jgi:hypothetical protein